MIDEAGLSELIEKEVLAFDEVSRFTDADLTDNIQAVFGRGHYNPGIRITEEEGRTTINLELIVYFGTNIPQLCYDIQSKVRNHLQSQTGLDIKAVNIRIEGIDKKE